MAVWLLLRKLLSLRHRGTHRQHPSRSNGNGICFPERNIRWHGPYCYYGKSQNFYEKELGYKIPLAPPFVGRDFNVTRAGIHADGVAKDEEIYNIFNTAKLLNRPLSVEVNKNSGLAGVAYWLNQTLHLEGRKQNQQE